ncbi:hypothetical protein Tco_0667371 [Tanacetum coccineum]
MTMSTPKFAKTHNLVMFLEKPKESNGFKGIIDFLNASSIKYALTVNPTVYESCIKQFWATTKAKTVNGDRQIQALVDKKKVIITEKSVRSDLILEDAEGTECLPNDVIFEQLTLMGFVQVFLDKQVEGMSKHKGIYVTPSHTKKIFANIKRERKGFSGRITPLFQTMMVQAIKDMGKDSVALTDSHSTPIITQPSSSKPQKKKSGRKQKKDSGPTEPIPDEATNEEPISILSCDPPQSGEDRLQLTELMSLCTKLQKQVLDLEEAKTAQAKEIASLKKRVKQLEKRRKSRTLGLKRLRKVSSARRVESSNDVFEEPIVNVAKTTSSFLVSVADPVTIASEVVTTASATTTIDELTLAQALIEIKEAKPKAITTAATNKQFMSVAYKAGGPKWIQRISLTGFPAQSVGSSNTDVLDLPCLLVLITGTSQSRQHADSCRISTSHLPQWLFDDDDWEGFSFALMNTKNIMLNVLAESQG